MTTPFDPYSTATSLANPGASGAQIPGSALGASGMTINTSQLNVTSEVAGGLFGYSGPPDSGTLFFSVTPAGGIDPYGNTYPTGISVTQGQLSGVNLTGVGMDATSTLIGSTINQGNINTPAIQGGTAVSSLIVLNNTGGQVLSYSASNASTTFTSSGSSLWTVPAGVTQVRVQCWGSGGGGGGGSTLEGGESAGGGEYAEEPALPVVPGAVLTVNVGGGGNAGATGFAGSNGASTNLTDQNGNNLVYANGGLAGSNFTGGPGGTGSVNTIHFGGGAGADASGNSGASGGGSSAGTGVAGNTGSQSAGSSGGAGGAAPSGGGAGGTGGANGANGVVGSAPGGGGGGAGEGTASNAVVETFYPDSTYSYYSNSGLRNTDGNMFHGAYSGEAPNYQYSYIKWAKGDRGNNLNTVLNLTVNAVTLRLTNLHSWYNNGMTFGIHSSTVIGSSSYSVLLSSAFISEGNTFTFTLGAGTWTPFQTAGTFMVLAPNSANQTNLNWYGYFDGDSGNTASMPRIQVNYQSSGAGSFNAGAGGNGKAVISWSTSSQLVGAVSPAAGNDGLGNSFAAGVTSTQKTFLGQGSAPPTPAAGNVVLYSSTASSGNLVKIKDSGWTGYVPDSKSGGGGQVATGTGFTTISDGYVVTSTDVTTGTVFRLTAWGHGTTGTAMDLHMNIQGGNAEVDVPGTAMNNASGIQWEAVAHIRFTSATVANVQLRLSVSGFPGSNGWSAVGSSRGNTITFPYTAGMFAKWSNTTGAPTVTCDGTLIERLAN